MSLHFDYAPSTTLDQMLGFEMAAGIWSDYLDDDVTVNFYIDIVDILPDNVIGGALPGIRANQSYATWRTQLANDSTTADDLLALSNLQNDASQFTALIDGYQIDDNEHLTMTRANAKALGMLDGNATDLDGYILVSDLTNQPNYSWNYAYLHNFVPQNTIDFLSVALHEIGHVLGFISGIDRPGWLIETETGSSNLNDFYDSLMGNLNHATSLDLFRYSEESLTASGNNDVWIDLSIGGSPFFSVEGNDALNTNATDRYYFSTGKNESLGGDSAQASHWKADPGQPLGIMDPYISAGQRREVSGVDLLAFDAIGWDRTAGGTDLTALYAQAEQQLANRLGISVNDLSDVTVQALTTFEDLNGNSIDDRVEQMVIDSEIYEWGSSSSGGPWQEFLEQELSAQTVGTQNDPSSVPEPGTALGLWGIGLSAIGSALKRRCRNGGDDTSTG